MELGNVCRHAVVTPRGLLSELRPFVHTAWLLDAKPDGWEGGRFHLPNISKCGKVAEPSQLLSNFTLGHWQFELEFQNTAFISNKVMHMANVQTKATQHNFKILNG